MDEQRPTFAVEVTTCCTKCGHHDRQYVTFGVATIVTEQPTTEPSAVAANEPTVKKARKPRAKTTPKQ